MVVEDVLTDIQLMARADYFVHASSAVAEAVFYHNSMLMAHNRSVNLEYQVVNRTYPWRRDPWRGLGVRGIETNKK